MHDKKAKGDKGVALAIADLTLQDCNVLIPLSEHSKYDLAIEINGKRLASDYRKLGDRV